MGKLKLPKLWIEYEVRDKDGKLLKRGKLKSQTWVGNIVAFLSALLSMWGVTATGYRTGTSRADMTDTGGSARGVCLGSASATRYLGGSAPAGNTSAGILVGSSNVVVAIGQYALQSPIAHGTGAGQLQYGATTVDPLVKNTTWTVRVIRTFTNASGATVTVREFGLFVRLGMVESPYEISVMLARDVPVTAIDVPDGSTLTLRYIISHTV